MPSATHVVAVVGPTASGKTDLAQALAVRLGAEILSCDSMQIYRGMDIGTAKLPENERLVPHHGIDIVEAGTPYSAAMFQSYARSTIDDIAARGKLPLLCGGTGFYVRAAIDDYRFPEGEQVGNPVRDTWNSYAEEHGAEALWEQLNLVDPASAADIHPHNVKRVVRAFELLAEGCHYHDQKEALATIAPWYPCVMIGLNCEREVLYRRINARVDAMFAAGLVEEVQSLLDRGLAHAVTAQQAIGYKEIAAALAGTITLDEAREQIKQSSRRYAKRQISWFKRDPRTRWLDASMPSDELIGRALEIAATTFA